MEGEVLHGLGVEMHRLRAETGLAKGHLPTLGPFQADRKVEWSTIPRINRDRKVEQPTNRVSSRHRTRRARYFSFLTRQISSGGHCLAHSVGT